jgi:hypothetical protein
MSGDSSAYAALGLEPGADSAAIDRAYKRLIKQHHPDREGGDARRAAEINRAYRELKKGPPQATVLEKDPLDLHDHPIESRDPINRWVLAAMLVVAAVGTLVLSAGPMRPLGSNGAPLPLSQVSARAAPMDAMDQPLGLAAIDSAVRDARQIARTSDEMGLSQASDACHRQLRGHPSVLQLDRCAAFDDAVVQLQDRDPLRDRGPFSELAVTGRQWSAASALSSDNLAIDGRLDRIRLRVEMQLAPVLPPDSN